MKCPCGCPREVPNGHYWATENCGKRAKKHGLYMPMNGEWRQDERTRKKLQSLKKGKNDGRTV